jgi:hypothetical protein
VHIQDVTRPVDKTCARAHKQSTMSKYIEHRTNVHMASVKSLSILVRKTRSVSSMNGLLIDNDHIPMKEHRHELVVYDKNVENDGFHHAE